MVKTLPSPLRLRTDMPKPMASRVHARIPLDNNQSEKDLRHVVIGRKNWNFAGFYEGAHRLATFFTLMQCCRRVQLNPWLYLAHVFSVIEDYSSKRLGGW
jgi:hypothetical protein